MEKRAEKRLRYHWPVWFGHDYNDILQQGQMVDVSSGGAAFTCYNDCCPYPGEHITARFSVPKYDDSEDFNVENYIRDGKVCRIQEISPYVRKVAVQFERPLPFKPGEIVKESQDAVLV